MQSQEDGVENIMGEPAGPSGNFNAPNGGANMAPATRTERPAGEEEQNGSAARSDFVTRYPIVSMVGVAECVHRLMKFNEDQRKRKLCNNGLDKFWRPFVKEYFSENSEMLLDISNKKTKKSQSIKLKADVLSRVLKAKYDSGVVEERILLENPCEFVLYSGIVVVDCPRATIITDFPDSRVLTEGHLRVSFASGLKITCWEFSTQNQEELVRIDDARPREPSVNDFGLPDMYSRYMQISGVINQLRDKISSNVEYIVQQSQGQMQRQTQPNEDVPEDPNNDANGDVANPDAKDFRR